VGVINNQEGKVQQPISTAATYTQMYCFQNGTVGVALTYTFRDNNTNTGLSCTIPAGSTTAIGSGSATVAPGDLVSVGTPSAGTPGAFGAFTVSQ
jgi:hypothetical protein